MKVKEEQKERSDNNLYTEWEKEARRKAAERKKRREEKKKK